MKVAIEAERDPHKKKVLNSEWELNKVKAARGYQILKEDTALAKANPDVEMLTLIWRSHCQPMFFQLV